MRSDPIRIKNAKEIVIGAKSSDGVERKVYILAEKELVENTPEEDMKKKIAASLSQISPSPVSGIYSTHLSFQYSEPDVLKDFDYGNILVQAHIPYCLHIPNYYEMEVSVPEANIEALVVFEKVWTNRATEDGRKSDVTTDFYAEDDVLYFKHSTLLTPKIPVNPEEGWAPYFTGRNIEAIEDRNGVFRYTRMHIQFTKDVTHNIKDLTEKQATLLLAEIKSEALLVINRVIDTYRHVTNDSYVRRLGNVEPNLIYFIPQNEGFYLLSPNLETARINRSKKELDEIENKLKNNVRPDITELLFLDAESSLKNKDYMLAIVESYQALEILIENYLFSALKENGLSDEDCVKKLKQYWQTKDRLNTLMKEVKNTSLNTKTDIWDKWCTRYDKTRNEVFHHGKEPTQEETKQTLEVNIQVADWIKSI